MICGVDPGVSGAIAWLSDTGHLVEVLDLPTIEVQVGKTKRRRLVPAALSQMLLRPGRRPVHVWLEEVGSQPGEGAVGAFAFGRGFGAIEGVLAGLGLPHTLVRPQVWKRGVSVPADKGAARMRAAQLWPGIADQFARVKDDGRAEAALIGLYGANKMQGDGRAAA